MSAASQKASKRKQKRSTRKKVKEATRRGESRATIERIANDGSTKKASDLSSGKKHKKQVAPLKPCNQVQSEYMQAIENYGLVFGIGPAGTGKTYVCGSLAADALENGEVNKIVITRPAVEAEEDLGYLPGKEYEKYEPYLRPFRDVLDERLGASNVDNRLKNEDIVPSPFAYMRGSTFKNAFVVLDEAQNATPGQLKMFLTRIGQGATVVVNGDPKQTDLEPGKSGLLSAMDTVRHLPDVRVIEFEKEDVVRSDLGQQIVDAYEG